MTAQTSGARWRALTGAALSAALGGGTYLAGRRDLQLPGIETSLSWSRWWNDSGALSAVFSIGRALVILLSALAVFGFVATAVELSLRARTSAELTARLTTFRIPLFGSVLRLAMGLAAAGAGLAACGSSGTGPGAGPPAAPTLVDAGPQGSAVAAPAGPPVARTPPSLPSSSPTSPPAPRAAGSDPPTGAGQGALPAPAAPAADPTQVPADAGGHPQSWQVRPGDSLWSIAEAVVGGPTERVAAYWEQLMAVNRSHLPDPSDPSLLFPGDVVVLPPAPAPRS